MHFLINRTLGLLLTMLTSLAIATEQIPDVIRLEGVRYELQSDPLAVYLTAHPDHLLPKTIMSTAKRRGYVASWELRDGKLLLNAIDVDLQQPLLPLLRHEKLLRHDSSLNNVMGFIFPGVSEVFASWYSGLLVVPVPPPSYYFYRYGIERVNYWVFRLDKGRVLERLDFNEYDFRNYRLTKAELIKQSYAMPYFIYSQNVAGDWEDFLLAK